MLYPMIATGAIRGAAQRRVVRLEVASPLDFDRSQIEVSKSYDGKTKSGKTRHVPIRPPSSRASSAIWRDRPDRADGGLVFPVEERMGRGEETLGLGELMAAAFGREPPKCWHKSAPHVRESPRHVGREYLDSVAAARSSED